jgi:hypothetical protein
MTDSSVETIEGLPEFYNPYWPVRDPNGDFYILLSNKNNLSYDDMTLYKIDDGKAVKIRDFKDNARLGLATDELGTVYVEIRDEEKNARLYTLTGDTLERVLGLGDDIWGVEFHDVNNKLYLSAMNQTKPQTRDIYLLKNGVAKLVKGLESVTHVLFHEKQDDLYVLSSRTIESGNYDIHQLKDDQLIPISGLENFALRYFRMDNDKNAYIKAGNEVFGPFSIFEVNGNVITERKDMYMKKIYEIYSDSNYIYGLETVSSAPWWEQNWYVLENGKWNPIKELQKQSSIYLGITASPTSVYVTSSVKNITYRLNGHSVELVSSPIEAYSTKLYHIQSASFMAVSDKETYGWSAYEIQ